MPAKKSTLATRILAARKAAGLSQVALAKAAGVPQSSLSEIEAGKHEPGFCAGVAIALALGIEPAELAGVKATK